MVLPIWEGAGNIMTLDMLRASIKSEGFKVVCEEIVGLSTQSEEYGDWMQAKVGKLSQLASQFMKLSQDELETTCKYVFENLTTLFQMAQMIRNRDEESKKWIDIAIKNMKLRIEPQPIGIKKPLSVEEIDGLIAWEA